MSQALYRKYRSRSLDEVLGQDHVTNILRRALEQGKIAHAYLLTGPRGVGKTSVARILAHEINQLPYDEDASHLDIIEIDAASNNGVDDIRALREKAQVAPVSAPKKIYIIDEVHMLSKSLSPQNMTGGFQPDRAFSSTSTELIFSMVRESFSSSARL